MKTYCGINGVYRIYGIYGIHGVDGVDRVDGVYGIYGIYGMYGMYGIYGIHNRACFLPCSHLRIIFPHVVLVPLLWWAPLVGMPIVVAHIWIHLSLHAVVL